MESDFLLKLSSPGNYYTLLPFGTTCLSCLLSQKLRYVNLELMLESASDGDEQVLPPAVAPRVGLGGR